MNNNNQLIIKENKNDIIQTGKEILDENDFFKSLESIMSNNTFRTFYNKYFKDFSDIKIVVLYMKLYETIQIEYKECHGIEIEKEFLAYIMKELMNDNLSRKQIMESFHNFTDIYNYSNKKFILDIFEKNKNNKKLK